ncbi:MAG: sigma 54-interacting transcriptional regulator [Gemmatimonadota bacterium]
MPYRNPYLNRSMIRAVDGFYGRRRELERLMARVGASPPQSVSLVGECRIGKSSLLWHLSRPEVYSRFLDEAGQYLFLLLDFQGLRHLDLPGFCRTFTRHLAEVAPAGLEITPADDLNALEAEVRRCAAADLRLVCLFDEFETVTGSPVFGSEFFGFLRSLANAYPLALVAASRRPLRALCHTRAIAESPFFNIFAEVHLGPLLDDEARALICEPSAGSDHPLEPHADPLIDLAGCLPFFLQVACSAAFECLAESGDGRLEPVLLVRRFREEADSHFHYLWEHFEDGERAVLAALLAGRSPPDDLGPATRSLLVHGYLRERPGGLAPFSDALVPFLREHDLLASVPAVPSAPPAAPAPLPANLARAPASIAPVPAGSHPFPALIGDSEAVRQCLALMQRAAASDAAVLLLGDTGTGKELVARSIHQASARARQPFVVVNCGAIAEHLQESELFGHKRGAFTDAVADRAGLFEAADGGLLLLDEIAETTPATQAKLLRVLQEGEIRRVGENAPRRVDVRVVAATNRDLEAEVREGRFRQDLFYRLHVLVIRLPALRERREDIPELIRHFAGHGAALSDEAVQQLCAYDWPGNVRELENQIASARALAGDGEVDVRHLWQHVQGAVAPLGSPAPEAAGELSLKEAREAFERRTIEARLQRFGWDADRAAQSLGISRSRLYDLLRKYGLRREPG